MLRLLFFINFIFSSIVVYAQESIIVYVKNEKNEAIQFYNLINFRDKKIVFEGDKDGKTLIPFNLGFSYKLSAVGYPDTVITLTSDRKALTITRTSQNTLDEVVIKPHRYAEQVIKYISPMERSISLPPWNNAIYDHEVTRLIKLDQASKIDVVSLKASFDFPVELSTSFYLNIYRTTPALLEDINRINAKEVSNYSISSPELIFSTLLSKRNPVNIVSSFLEFDLSKENVEVEEGTYLISILMKAGISKGIRVYFSREMQAFGPRSNATAKRVGWYFETWKGRYLNPILNLKYRELKN